MDVNVLLKQILTKRNAIDITTEPRTYWALTLAIDILIDTSDACINIDLEMVTKPD